MKNLAILLAVVLLSSSGESGGGELPQPEAAAAQDEYVEVTAGGGTEIYVSSSASSSLVARAEEGDVFELRASEGDWFVVLLFTGEARYIEKSAAQPIAHGRCPMMNLSVGRSFADFLRPNAVPRMRQIARFQ